MQTTDSKTKLLEKALAGESGALEGLIVHCYPDVSHFAKKVCRNDQDAEEATQHTVTVLWKKIRDFRQEAKLTTWLYSVVKNECLRLKDRYFRQKQTLQQAHQLADHEVDSKMKEYLLQVLSEVIADLNDDDRELIILHEIDGTKLQEIADRRKLPLNTIKTRIRRARMQMKEKLEASLLSGS